MEVDKSYVTTASMLFDALFIPGGRHVEILKTHGDAVHYIEEMFKHGKPIGATDEALELMRMARLPGIELASSEEVVESNGVVTVAGDAKLRDRMKGAVGMSERTGLGGFTARFLEAAAQHRHWDRAQSEMVPA